MASIALLTLRVGCQIHVVHMNVEKLGAIMLSHMGLGNSTTPLKNCYGAGPMERARA